MQSTSTSSSAPVSSTAVPMAVQHTKRSLYIKVFKQEFIRELTFIWDVVAGRATARDSFTTKIAGLLKNNATSIPLLGDAIDKFASAIEFAANEVRDKEMGGLASIVDQLDLNHLDILMDVVAREAYRRYEFFIENRLTDDAEDGVIPFAKVGVARCLEYLARKRTPVAPAGWVREKLKPVLGDIKTAPAKSGDKKDEKVELSESFLLAGLVEGRSGQFIQGWTNNKVKLNRKEKNFLGQEKTVEVDIEDAYARSAFIHFDIKLEQLTQKLYTRAKARHQEGGGWQQVQAIFKGETESLYDFGHVKHRKEKEFQTDPLCGYAVMPLKAITNRYDFKAQDDKTFSRDFQSELQRRNLSVVQIDKATLKNYVTWFRQNTPLAKNTVADYLCLKQIWQGAKWVICADDLTGLDLKGVNLSNMDLSGATLGGDLTGTNFADTYLISAIFNKGTIAKQANFSHAHCAFLRAEGADFTSADFTQANFSYAKLAGANVTSTKLLGATWYQADLKNTKSDVDLLKEQQTQLKQLDADVKLQRAEMQQFSETLAAQTEKLNQLREQVDAKIQQTLMTNKDNKDTAQLQSLSDQVQQLVKQQQARAVFERSCQSDVKQLQQFIQQAASKDALDELKQQLQQTQQQLKTIQKNNNQATQQVPQELASQINALGSPYAALKQNLLKIQTGIQQELQALAKKLDECFKGLETQITQVEKQLAARLEQLEKRVDVLEKWVDAAKKDIGFVEQTVPVKLAELRKRALEDKDTQDELANYIPACGAHRVTDTNTFDMEKAATDFFKTNKQVLLLLGNSGGGKSTFNRYLAKKLWENYKVGDPIPLFISLPNLHNPEKALLVEHLTRQGFTEKEIQFIIKNHKLILILDGYDEMRIGDQMNQFKNLYTSNQLASLPSPGLKILISCRTEHLTKVDRYERYFMPGQNEKLQPAAFMEIFVAPFNIQQITAYITKYLELHIENTLKDISAEWQKTETYLQNIGDLPGMRELITTPFLLMIAMDVMPEIVEKYKHLDEAERLKLTGANLYDAFIKKWFERQADKLMVEGGLPEDGHDVMDDFMDFSKELAKAMHFAKASRVYYKPQSNLFEKQNLKDQWSENFFSDKNKDMMRARKGCPLKKVAPFTWAFIHASLMEHFVTKDIYDNLTDDSSLSSQSQSDYGDSKSVSSTTRSPVAVFSPSSTAASAGSPSSNQQAFFAMDAKNNSGAKTTNTAPPPIPQRPSFKMPTAAAPALTKK